MFAVVIFLATNEVDVVPVCWLNEGKDGIRCFWPPYETLLRIEKAKLSREPTTSQWSLHSVKCLYKASMYYSCLCLSSVTTGLDGLVLSQLTRQILVSFL